MIILKMIAKRISRSMRQRSTARSSVVALTLMALLANSWGTASPGQRAQTATTQRDAARSSIRIMPPDASSFLVDQRFDIRVEAPTGAGNSLRIALDGRDISEWNNRSHLTGDGSSTGATARWRHSFPFARMVFPEHWSSYFARDGGQCYAARSVV